jgi:hypothetical protein
MASFSFLVYNFAIFNRSEKTLGDLAISHDVICVNNFLSFFIPFITFFVVHAQNNIAHEFVVTTN